MTIPAVLGTLDGEGAAAVKFYKNIRNKTQMKICTEV